VLPTWEPETNPILHHLQTLQRRHEALGVRSALFEEKATYLRNKLLAETNLSNIETRIKMNRDHIAFLDEILGESFPGE